MGCISEVVVTSLEIKRVLLTSIPPQKITLKIKMTLKKRRWKNIERIITRLTGVKIILNVQALQHNLFVLENDSDAD